MNKKYVYACVAIAALVGAYLVGQAMNDHSLAGQSAFLELQDTCRARIKSIEANNVFNGNPQFFSHYNTKLNKCFIQVTSGTFNKDGSYSTSDDIFDSETGKIILSRWLGHSGAGDGENNFDYRPVNGSSMMKSMTKEEFLTLRDQYMND